MTSAVVSPESPVILARAEEVTEIPPLWGSSDCSDVVLSFRTKVSLDLKENAAPVDSLWVTNHPFSFWWASFCGLHCQGLEGGNTGLGGGCKPKRLKYEGGSPSSASADLCQ